MPRHVIIDGYNLLGVRGQAGRPDPERGEAAREALLRELALYRQRRGHAVTVVFDAWQQGPGAERREHRAGVEVVYTRRGERADRVIQRLAEEFGSDCAVVSSDREVADYARARGAFIIAAREFAARLQAAPAVPAARPGPGRDEEDVTPRKTQGKRGNPRKLPKAVRKRLRQLDRF